jgi:hypothetical protein
LDPFSGRYLHKGYVSIDHDGGAFEVFVLTLCVWRARPEEADDDSIGIREQVRQFDQVTSAVREERE